MWIAPCTSKMASVRFQSVHLIILLVFISTLLCVSSLDAAIHRDDHQLRRSNCFLRTRRLLEEMKKPTKNLSSNNKTKPINSSSKNQTKLLKPSNSTTLTGLIKLNSTSNSMIKVKKLNSTSNSKLKKLNSTSNSSSITKKSTKPNLEIQNPKIQTQPSWIEQYDGDDDLVSEIKDLPNKFHQTLIPDLEKISTTSKAYITKYNKEIIRNFKPIVGKQHAPTIATVISGAFIAITLALLSLIFKRVKSYFSLQKLLVFVQIYLCIYFSILCLSSLVTGLEPLRFFYATSQSTYACVQVIQSLGYVFYLLMLLMYLVLVFSSDCGLGLKMVGLAQTVVGFSIGLHYYVAVFHRMVLRQPPKTSWKIHGIYATCFFLICFCSNVEGRKKAYLEESGEEGKKK